MSRTDNKEYLKVSYSSYSVKGGFYVYSFMEDDNYIMYMPSLELSGYGDNKQEAWEMLKETIEVYFFNILKSGAEKGTQELKKYGWIQQKYFPKRFQRSNTFIDKEGVLQNFDLDENTAIEENFFTV